MEELARIHAYLEEIGQERTEKIAQLMLDVIIRAHDKITRDDLDEATSSTFMSQGDVDVAYTALKNVELRRAFRDLLENS